MFGIPQVKVRTELGSIYLQVVELTRAAMHLTKARSYSGLIKFPQHLAAYSLCLSQTEFDTFTFVNFGAFIWKK